MLRSAAVGAAVVIAFAGGLVVGVGGRSNTAGGTAQQGATQQGTAQQGATQQGTKQAGAGRTPIDATNPLTQAQAAITADAAHPPASGTLDAAAIKAMLASLGDPWASYHPAGEADATTATLDGSYAGLGLWLRSQPDGEVLVSSVLPGSSASAGGVMAGDHLISVTGQPARGVPLASVVTALRGPAGSTVRITTATSAGSLHTSVLTRAEVAVDDSAVQRLSGGIVLARVAAFSRGVSQALAAGLAKARAAGQIRGIVLDLRGDPGGLLNEGVAVASQFLNGGTVVTDRERNEPTQTLSAVGHGNTTTPLAVLVDGGTASAAEVVAGALQDRHRALLVGAKTFGKGTIQEPVTLSDGSVIEFTVGHYTTPGGHSLDGVGLTPDIPVAASAATGTANDPALAEAETVVGALLADAGTKSGSGRG